MTRDILCASCSDVALSVSENLSAADIVNRERVVRILCGGCFCQACKTKGRVEQVDDGERAMLVFRTESET